MVIRVRVGSWVGIPLTPGFLGTPAGMTTRLAPVKAFLRPSSGGRKPSTFDWVLMWERSAATPGVLTISNKLSYLRDVRAARSILYLLGYLSDKGVGLEQQGEWLTDSTWID